MSGWTINRCPLYTLVPVSRCRGRGSVGLRDEWLEHSSSARVSVTVSEVPVAEPLYPVFFKAISPESFSRAVNTSPPPPPHLIDHQYHMNYCNVTSISLSYCPSSVVVPGHVGVRNVKWVNRGNLWPINRKPVVAEQCHRCAFPSQWCWQMRKHMGHGNVESPTRLAVAVRILC